jgi:tetratricopeptide (TPR) repeat protein
MTSTPFDRNLEPQVNPQQEYRALVRSLKFTQGFGLLFVQCSPAEGKRLIKRVKKDLPQKQIEVLSLTEPIETLYDKVEALYQNKPIEVLFVQGIEHSLYDYEKNRLWSDDAQRLNYSETGVPRLLQHLNLSRERFRESFLFHFVFLVSPFALKYLTRRAPDFFDWRSGVLAFPTELEQLRKESSQATIERSLKDNPQSLPPEEFRKSVLTIQSLLEEPQQSSEYKAGLLFELTQLFDIAEDEEAVIAGFDKALQNKPDCPETLNNRGVVLGNLGRYEAAITSFDKALQFNPECSETWCNRGIVLGNLGRYEEAITSFDKALQFNPDKDEAWYNKACCYALKVDTKAAIENLSRAIALNPDEYQNMAKTDSDFDSIRHDKRFQALIDGI